MEWVSIIKEDGTAAMNTATGVIVCDYADSNSAVFIKGEQVVWDDELNHGVLELFDGKVNPSHRKQITPDSVLEAQEKQRQEDVKRGLGIPVAVTNKDGKTFADVMREKEAA